MAKNFSDIRLAFMGTSKFAEIILKDLIDAKANIVLVLTRPDKPSGREQEISRSPVKIMAEEYKIEVLDPSKFEGAAIEKIRSARPDLIVVAAYGMILPKAILEIPRYGSINIHASLLPKFRGPSPIQNALLLGERETGITLIRMNEKIDEGEIIAQEKTAIGQNETAPELAKKLSCLGSKLLIETIPLWISGEIDLKVQNPDEATLCQLVEREDGRIIWSDDAETIYNKYRAFTPWPGIFTYWERNNINVRLKIKKISFQRQNPENRHHLGEIFELGDKIGVQANLGVVILEEIQIEGKDAVPIQTFLNGYPGFIGSVLK